MNVDYDRAANFEEYEMFSWQTGAITVDNPANIELPTNIGYPTENPLIHNWTQAAVENELMIKGYTKPMDGEPRPGDESDLVLICSTNVQAKEDVYLVDSFGVRFPYSWKYRENLTEQVEWYYEVTLVLDIVDAKSNQLIWRGLGSGIVGDLEKSEETIKQAAKKMLEKFPPPFES